jgi:polar amino acid transport system substrate-binding protein
MLKSKTFTAIGAAFVMLAGATFPAVADAYGDIIAAGKIRISTDMANPPFGMLDASMNPTGSDVETARLLAADWGLELEFVQTTGPTRIPNLQTNKADIVIATFAVTPERAEVIDFSKAYAAQLSVVAAPAASMIADWEDLRETGIAVVRGSTQDNDVTAKSTEFGFTVNRYEDEGTLFTAAVSGQAGAIATSAVLVQQIAARNQNLGFQSKFLIRANDLAIGVRKGEARLLEKLNEWVTTNLKNGKLNEIYMKYNGESLPEAMLQ